MNQILTIKATIKRIVFDTLVRIKWSKRPNSIFVKKNTSTQCDNLSKFGIIKIDENFSEFADYLSEEYEKKILNNEKTKFPIYNTSSFDNGIAINCCLPLNDKKISDFILSKKLSGILENVYGRRSYLRHDPILQRIETKVQVGLSEEFHMDRYMQFTLMLLLKDIDEKTTHMQYLLSSHKRKFPDLIIHKNLQQVGKAIKKNDYKLFKCCGKKGDVFLFNSMGIHRANYIIGTTRSVLHVVFTNGHNLYNYENLDNQNLNFIDKESFETINRKSDKIIFYNKKRSQSGNFQFFHFQR